jgi:tetratricopeptide (TPR) repeat protein
VPEAVRRLLQALVLTPGGEVPAPAAAPQPTESAEDLLARGKALVAQNKYDEALPLYQRATQLASSSFDVWANLGFAYDQIGESGPAVKAYDQALAVDANQAWVWNNKGLALRQLGRDSDALKAYDRAIALDPDAVVWRNKGQTLNDLRRYAGALTAFERSLTLEPTSVRGWTGKAAALRGLGRRAEAETAERRAKELGG